MCEPVGARVCAPACVCRPAGESTSSFVGGADVCVRGGCLLPSDTLLCWEVSVFCLSSGNV